MGPRLPGTDRARGHCRRCPLAGHLSYVCARKGRGIGLSSALWFPTLLGWVSAAAGMVLAGTDYQLQTLGAVRRGAYAKDPSCQAVRIRPPCFWEERERYRGDLGSVCPQCQRTAPGLSYFTGADKLVGDC